MKTIVAMVVVALTLSSPAWAQQQCATPESICALTYYQCEVAANKVCPEMACPECPACPPPARTYQICKKLPGGFNCGKHLLVPVHELPED